MAPDLDGVAYAHVLALDAPQQDSLRISGFEGPRCRSTFFVLHVEVDDRMRDDQDHLFDRALHHGPLRQIVVAVGMMGKDRHGQACRTNGRNAEGFAAHVALLVTWKISPEPQDLPPRSSRSVDRRFQIPKGMGRDRVWKLPLAVSLRIDGPIPNRQTLLVGPCQRLHEKYGLWHTRRDGRLVKIEATCMLMDRRVRAR